MLNMTPQTITGYILLIWCLTDKQYSTWFTKTNPAVEYDVYCSRSAAIRCYNISHWQDTIVWSAYGQWCAIWLQTYESIAAPTLAQLLSDYAELTSCAQYDVTD